jgi:hypothetical protein
VEDIELAIEPTTPHGFHDSQGPIKAPHQQHPDQVRVCPVRVQIGPRPECPDLHSVNEPVIFLMNHVNVTETEKENMDEFVRHPHVTERVHQMKDRRCAQKRHESQHDYVGFQSDKRCKQKTFFVNVQRAHAPKDVAGIGKGKKDPEQENETIHDEQSPEHCPQVHACHQYQHDRDHKRSSSDRERAVQSHRSGESTCSNYLGSRIKLVNDRIAKREFFHVRHPEFLTIRFGDGS